MRTRPPDAIARRTGLVVAAAGLATVAFAALADAIGAGGSPGLGAQQKLGVLAGIVVVAGGSWLALAAGSRSRRTLVARAAVSSVALIAGLFCVEVGLRYAAHRTRRGLEDLPEESRPHTSLGSIYRLSRNERIVYELKPNLRDVLFQDVPVSTNSRGFRGPEVDEVKPPGVVRILGAGDSTMFGWGVREEETFLARLEAELDAAHPGRVWEVVNTAVPGHNTVMEVEMLREKGLALDPDVVVIHLMSNDLNLPLVLHRKEEDSLGLHRSFLLDFARERLGLVEPRTDLFVPLDLEATDYRRFEQDPDLVRPEYRDLVGWGAFDGALDDLATLSRENGFEVVALTLWWYSILEEMKVRAASRGFTTVTVIPDRPRSAGWALAEGLKLSERDPHPSAKMHALTAAALRECMERSGIVARATE